jgi:hypothetical protein
MIPSQIRIRGPLKAGQRVVKMTTQRVPKELRFFNPNGEQFEALVPNDPFYIRMVVDGLVEIVTEQKPAPVKRGDK